MTDRPIGVRRVTQIFDEPKFFIDGAGADDVVQGANLGDCWFISALAAMCTSKGLVEKLCVKVSVILPIHFVGVLYLLNVLWP
jgi:hypothetical protein